MAATAAAVVTWFGEAAGTVAANAAIGAGASVGTAATVASGAAVVAEGITAYQGAKAIGSLLSPKTNAPQVSKPTEMPDPLAQQDAAKQRLIRQMADRGRVATVLTSPQGNSDRLGG